MIPSKLILPTALAAALAAGAGVVPAAAQAPPAPVRAGSASPRLPAEHWAVRAAWRAEGLGLAPEFLPAERAVSRSAVEAALREAAGRAAGTPLAATADAWLARFREEFPEYRPVRAGNDAPLVPLGGFVAAGAQSLAGRAEPAARLDAARKGPAPVEDEDGLAYRSAFGVGFGRWMAASAEQVAFGTEIEVPRWEVAIGAGAWGVSVGAEPVGYGRARGGGVVLSGAQPLTRLAVETRRPLALPGRLAVLGRATAQSFVAPVSDARHPGDPLLWGLRLALRPHDRFTVALNRAALLGGSAVPEEADAGTIAGLLAFRRQTGFRNEVTSFDARWRLPTEAVLPLVAHAEWGVDDAAQRWTQAPGVVAGLEVPAVPGAPWLSGGAEHATFRGRCCDIAPWYFDNSQSGGWVIDGEPLGHPLGGEGRETSAYARAEPFGARVRVEARAFARRREPFTPGTPSGNLYAPLLAGPSAGGEVDAAVRLLGRGELRLRWSRDDGDGWRRETLAADLAFLF